MTDKKGNKIKTPVDGDILYDLLYHILWCKETMYEESNFQLFLPDTVIFQDGSPLAWYFSDSEGVVKKKKIENMNTENILKTFIRKKSKHDIVGYYITIPWDIPEENRDENAIPQVEYFNENDFKIFLKNTSKLRKGILQRFIEPASVIQAVWADRISIFSKRVNTRELSDTSANIFEKCVTFDGPDYLSELVPLRAPSISAQIKKLMELIIRHITNVSFEKYKISKMVTYFKIDSEGRFWYLWSGYVRFSQKVLHQLHKNKETEEDERVNTDPIELEDHITIPNNIYVAPKPSFSRIPNHHKLRECVRCEEGYPSNHFVEIEYQKIVEEAENVINEDERTVDAQKFHPQKLMICPKDAIKYKESAENLRVRNKNADIPLFIRKLHPKLKVAEYQKLKTQPYFLNRKIEVCYNCYFYLLGINSVAGTAINVSKLTETDPRIRRALRPDALKLRDQLMMTNLAKNRTEAQQKDKNALATMRERSQSSVALRSVSVDRIRPKDTLELLPKVDSQKLITPAKDMTSFGSKLDSRRGTTSTLRGSRNVSLGSTADKTTYRSSSQLTSRDKSANQSEKIQPQTYANFIAQNKSKSISNIMNWFNKDSNIFATGKQDNIISNKQLANHDNPTTNAEILFGPTLDYQIQEITKNTMPTSRHSQELFEHFMRDQDNFPLEYLGLEGETNDIFIPNLNFSGRSRTPGLDNSIGRGTSLPPGLQGYVNSGLYKKTPNRGSYLIYKTRENSAGKKPIRDNKFFKDNSQPPHNLSGGLSQTSFNPNEQGQESSVVSLSKVIDEANKELQNNQCQDLKDIYNQRPKSIEKEIIDEKVIFKESLVIPSRRYKRAETFATKDKFSDPPQNGENLENHETKPQQSKSLKIIEDNDLAFTKFEEFRARSKENQPRIVVNQKRTQKQALNSAQPNRNPTDKNNERNLKTDHNDFKDEFI